MTDSTADSTETGSSTPQVLSTTTAGASAAPAAPTDAFGAEIPVAASEDGPVANESIGYSPDFVALQAANGEPSVFGHELHELIGHLTGKWIDEDTITSWFSLLGGQVQARTGRELIFRLANTPVPSSIKGDPALNLLDFRDDVTTDLRRAIGLS